MVEMNKVDLNEADADVYKDYLESAVTTAVMNGDEWQLQEMYRSGDLNMEQYYDFKMMIAEQRVDGTSNEATQLQIRDAIDAMHLQDLSITPRDQQSLEMLFGEVADEQANVNQSGLPDEKPGWTASDIPPAPTKVWTAKKSQPWDSGLAFVSMCGDVTKVPEIHISRQIYENLLSLVSYMDRKGLEFVAYFDYDVDEKGNYLVSEIIVPEQEVTGASADATEDTGLAQSGVVHLHPMGLKTFSGSDKKTINRNKSRKPAQTANKDNSCSEGHTYERFYECSIPFFVS